MAVKRKGLGKGLDSLIPENKSVKPAAKAEKEESVKTGGDSKILCTTQPERNSDRPFIARKTAGYKQEQRRTLQKSGTMGDGKNASKPAEEHRNVYTPKGSLAGIFRYRQKRRGLQRNSV